jgi:hypothetical protein
MRMVAVLVSAMGMMLLAAGCASADHPPTPTTASFNMQPVPKRDSAVRGLVTLPADAINFLAGNRPIRFVTMMENADRPDDRRVGIVRLSERTFGQQEPYTRRYRQIAQSDPDFTVRAAAIRALNRARDREAVPVFMKALSDESPAVRLQAAKALSNIPDPSASETLAKTLGNQAETRDVRIAAAEALRHYRDLGVARVLAGTLSGRDFSIAWQSRWSLCILTGHDHGYDEGKWLEYLTGPTKPLG